MSKKIKLLKLELTNFRNITNKVYNFNSNRVGIAGKNRIGKTNTILALHWLLTDKMLDGSSDVSSIKPLHDTSLKVEVKATFDVEGQEIVILKSYQEDWVKTRGTNELVLKGHITNYEINDISYAVSKALEEMQIIFGLDYIRFSNGNRIDSKINVNAMLINPYYLPQILTDAEEKTLRNFIVNLVGDVKDEDVFIAKAETTPCRDILTKYRGDHTQAMKYLKQQVNEVKEQIEEQQVLVNEYSKEEDVDTKELENAVKQIDELNKKLVELENTENPLDIKYSLLNNAIDELNKKFDKLADDERQKINNSNLIINSKVKALTEKKELLIYSKSKCEELKRKKDNDIYIAEKELTFKKSLFTNLEKTRDELREKARAIKNSKFEYEANKCPNCGYELNPEEVEEKRKAFELDKQQQLNKIQLQGQNLNLQLDSTNKEIEKLNQELFNLTQVIDNEQDEINHDNAIEEISNQIKEEQSKIRSVYDFETTDEMKDLLDKIQEKRKELEDIGCKSIDERFENEDLIKEIKSQINELEQVKFKHNLYLNTQDKKSNIERKIKCLVKELNTFETQLLALDLFVKTKLQMIDNNVANVFGDIKIKLIKENIKEGSWQQICKPCIKGKNTLFANGSTSEKITTGLAIIECVKRVLDLSNLPIIFDEGEALDRHSIQELQTNSQVITALVNDNYETPTVVNLER